MLENVTPFWKKVGKKEPVDKSKDAAKERLHLVLMQDRANVSADFLDMMKQEIVDVIKKYIDVNETDMDVKLENRTNNDGTTGAPALFANIPIMGINEEKKKESEEITKSKQEELDKDGIENKDGEDGKKVSSKTKRTRTTKTSKTAKALATKKAEVKEAKAKKKAVEDSTDKEKEESKVVKAKKTVSAKKSTAKAKTSETKKADKKEEN